MKAETRKNQLLYDAFKGKSPIFFHADNLDITFETYIKKIEGNTLELDNSVHPDFITEIMKAKRYSIQINMLKFETDEISTNGKDIIFPLKFDDTFENSRSAERYSFRKDENVVCKLLNPYDEETSIKKKIVDMSSTGLCIKSSANSGLFQPGTHFSKITIVIDDSVFFETSGSVIYVRKTMSKSRVLEHQIGFKFDSEIYDMGAIGQ